MRRGFAVTYKQHCIIKKLNGWALVSDHVRGVELGSDKKTYLTECRYHFEIRNKSSSELQAPVAKIFMFYVQVFQHFLNGKLPFQRALVIQNRFIGCENGSYFCDHYVDSERDKFKRVKWPKESASEFTQWSQKYLPFQQILPILDYKGWLER